ncbi:MAG: electron transfer flavoprotein subunit alpha [Legionellaceae bacterium]|nr:electron transfer flavoprotein subunit alpha [Legionellaceae bacterium]HCA90061.1 electron transfer flavoprotein subunit alpha [Legionellales bacterium]|tara:strand:+ start:4926 stop:5870 length:945 start_codon:yes stop_codon:yes gene_type:complete
MDALVIVEHNMEGVLPATFSVLAAANALNCQITALVIGHDCASIAQELAIIEGVTQVWVLDNEAYAKPLAESMREVIVKHAPSFDYILAPATTFGKNILPGVAACLDVSQVSDVSRIISEDTFEHPIYAGNVLETVQIMDKQRVLTIRPTAFNLKVTTKTACPIKQLDNSVNLSNHEISVLSQNLHDSSRPELASAKIVVAGGRGLQSAENFKLIEQLADTLNAAIGASRAAVDAGFISNDYQVGQTGKIIAPMLYIAIGISGAIQHLAGMKDAKIIVAINSDKDAPIMQIADYALVGDLFELIPKFIETLKTY